MNATVLLKFERHDAFGKCHFYPKNGSAFAIVALTGRKCLKMGELLGLSEAGFVLELSRWPHGKETTVLQSPATESQVALATRQRVDV